VNQAAALIVLGLLLVAGNQARQGTLGEWARAKFLNAADPIPRITREGRSLREGLGIDLDVGPANASGWIRPINAPTISAWGAPRDGGRRSHKGEDIGGDAYKGQPVVAVRAGTVSRVAGDGNCGLRAWVDHGDGWKTLYCHLDRLLVATGDRVAQGDPVGTCGNTGNAATTPAHVHFETHLNGTAVNPAGVIPAYGGASAPVPSGVI